MFATGYMFNTISEGRMVVFLKTDRDSEAIIRYSTSGILFRLLPPNIAPQFIHAREAGSRVLSLEIEDLVTQV